eukprot:CAMPEP_0118876934 /NCGR_PEP_ID=MMETSP1163-20130328/17422_1 /TAXON_ID=124430 /ORGANISM="Phaeomonas parva, Strain CCMP2877" /LENGTH=49 /DNA_ID= /DNA_START= /DNA_END= /DNA_ORIENTATION=
MRLGDVLEEVEDRRDLALEAATFAIAVRVLCVYAYLADWRRTLWRVLAA